jgi:hypothetical protein
MLMKRADDNLMAGDDMEHRARLYSKAREEMTQMAETVLAHEEYL